MSGSFWDPLVVVPILPRVKLAAEDITTGVRISYLFQPVVSIHPGLRWLTVTRILKSIRELLGVFLTPELSDLLLSQTEEESCHGVENHWLLRKSVASAFAQGYFQLFLYKKPKVG